MVINVVGNVRDGKGLATDARVLRSILPRHELRDVQYDAHTAPRADLNLFLEVCAPALHSAAPRNVLIPNVELYFTATHGQTAYDEIWCKTRHAEQVMRSHGRAARYVGWTTEDVYRPDIEREPVVLHMAGGSRFRNTVAVVGAWREYWAPGLPSLRVYGLPIVRQMVGHLPDGVEWIEWADREDLVRDMNRCLYHVLPSQYEGFGIALWEGRACGAVVVTTDADPMREGYAAARVPVASFAPIRRGCLVDGAHVTPGSVWHASMKAVHSTKQAEHGRAARDDWDRQWAAFVRAIREAVG